MAEPERAAMPAAERVVERVWLAKGPRFRSLARALVAQRIEDDQPVPMTDATRSPTSWRR